ncbi:MAG: type III secretion system chaperone [Succinivibrionaceae bacterium]|nr:type III secretion system chaperone [Succinivibrionaceae bacterium]
MIGEERARELVEALVGAGEGLDGHGDCQLAAASGRAIALHYTPGMGLLALGVVGPLPGGEELDLRILTAFMGANFLWQESEGETFAYDEDSNCIMMQRALTGDDPLSLDAQLEDFDQDLGHFSALLEQLPDEFEDYDAS